MEQDISFIGLGAMGWGMATNIRQKLSPHATMYINDINIDACERFKTEFDSTGPIEIVSTAKEAATKSRILVSIVPAAEHVRQVYLDAETGVLAAPKDDERLILECSTIDAASTKEVGKAIMNAGLGEYVDAPVSGGVRGAAAGTLAFMIGAPATHKHTSLIREVVGMMASPQKIFFCGSLGTGNAAKISNNYLSGIFLLAISEAYAIGMRSGVDKKVLHEVIQNSSGQSWLGENMPPVPGLNPDAASSRGYQPTFTFPLLLKDIGLGIEAGREVGIEPRLAEVTREVFLRAGEDERCKGKDFSSIYQFISDGGR